MSDKVKRIARSYTLSQESVRLIDWASQQSSLNRSRVVDSLVLKTLGLYQEQADAWANRDRVALGLEASVPTVVDDGGGEA